ncbi:hypothetical protein BHE74_00006812 [Ensete ventricosum]|nr:hypothetical protein BHE74_00006812 [Ensete ventricosum]
MAAPRAAATGLPRRWYAHSFRRFRSGPTGHEVSACRACIPRAPPRHAADTVNLGIESTSGETASKEMVSVGQSTDVDLNPPWKRCRSTMYKKYSDSARRWGPLRPRKTRRRVRFGCRTNERTNALVCVTWSVGPTHDASSNHRPGLDCGYVGSMVGRAASFG